MQYKFILITILIIPFLQAQAATVKLADTDYEFHGGFSGNIQFQKYSASEIGNLGTAINDVVVAIKPKNNKELIGLHAAVGNLQQQDIFHTTAPAPPMDIGLLYSWFEINRISGIHSQMGIIKSNASYEGPISYENPNIVMGATRRSQASYYTGFRINLQKDNTPMKVYAEFGAPDNIEKEQVTVGLKWTSPNDYLSVNFSNAWDERHSINAHGSLQPHKLLSIGFNIDQHTKTDYPDHLNDTAYGVAGYASLHFGNITIPIRGEVIDDGDTNIYSYGKGYSLTITPTFKIKKKIIVRAEGFYAYSNAKPFKDDRSFVDTQLGATVQIIWKI